MNNDGADLATTEVLDVSGSTSSAAPKLGIPCYSCAVVKLPGDHVPVIGGFSDDRPVLSTFEILVVPVEETQQ